MSGPLLAGIGVVLWLAPAFALLAWCAAVLERRERRRRRREGRWRTPRPPVSWAGRQARRTHQARRARHGGLNG